jgi:hypothetical protein
MPQGVVVLDLYITWSQYPFDKRLAGLQIRPGHWMKGTASQYGENNFGCQVVIYKHSRLPKAEFLNDCTEKSLQIADREREMIEIGTEKLTWKAKKLYWDLAS